ncbi:3732_t:CDS:2, partial [Gigaspora rosea]
TLQKSEQYLYLEESPVIQNRCKNKPPKYPLLKTAMTIWVNQASSAGMVLSDELVKLKDREFGNHLGIPENELKFSNGWVSNFKKRNFLHQYRFNGEAASAPLETLADERIKLRQLLSQYEPENIYNANEPGLFYRMLPNQTLAQQAVSGKKRNKSRLTVLLATNATGSHKLRPLVIGKSKKPWSFKGIKISLLPVMYENNERAWMKSDIWEKWLTFHDKDQRSEDNKLGSKYENGENFISEELAEELIGELEEALVEVLVEELVEELAKELAEELVEDRAEEFSDVTDITIQNCWSKTGILSDIGEVEMEITNQESESDFLDDEVAEIIVDLSSSDDPEASNIAQIMERYIQIVNEPVATEGILNDEEIITMVYNAIQPVLQYEEQTNSESNLELAELEFL